MLITNHLKLFCMLYWEIVNQQRKNISISLIAGMKTGGFQKARAFYNKQCCEAK